MVDANVLDVIENEYQERNMKLEIVAPEFTCLCPGKRTQPDFGTIFIEYVPDDYIIELKSLKLYIVLYRDEEIYHEPATNKILEDLVEVSMPRWMRVTGQFNTRGGIKTDATVEYGELDEEAIPTPTKTRAENLTRIPSER